MTLTGTKRDRVEALAGDLPSAGMTLGDVSITPTGPGARRERRRPIRTGHRLPPASPEAILRSFR
jgi:hypothetical protein